jgi:hypothetical protein
MQPGEANETGPLAVLRRMADESGGFVDDEQTGVFVEDVEHG